MTPDRSYVEAAPGKVVDARYEVKRDIARGGMGIVFEAEHKWLLERVALKTLTASELSRQDMADRFMREARALSIVRHPGIVSVLDAGVCAVHGPYIALELFEGRSLESYVVARQTLDYDSVGQIASQVGLALAHVHARGIVHRDVKPANVMVGREPGRDGDVLKLLDFGVAAIRGEDDVVDRKLTDPGQVIGTIEYMAPEQLLHGAPPSPATDIYGLGVLLYECLSGDVPIAGGPKVVMASLKTGRAPLPIRHTRPDVPSGLDVAILRALRLDPRERFETMAHFVAACVGGLPRGLRPLALLDLPRPEGVASRRHWARAAYVTPVRVSSSTTRNDGRSEDISEGGMLVVSGALCDEGEAVSLRFPLPTSGRVVAIEAIARWARTMRGQRALGLEFKRLDDDVRSEIRSYVALMAGAPSPRDSERSTEPSVREGE